MRMTRHLLIAVAPILLLASCDPFAITDRRANRPVPGDQKKPENSENSGSGDHANGGENARPQPDPRPVPDRHPVAQRTENPNQVISPHPPYNVIDVTGFNSGQLARDPSTGKIFRVP